jgi:hypothetical protein
MNTPAANVEVMESASMAKESHCAPNVMVQGFVIMEGTSTTAKCAKTPPLSTRERSHGPQRRMKSSARKGENAAANGKFPELLTNECQGSYSCIARENVFSCEIPLGCFEGRRQGGLINR